MNNSIAIIIPCYNAWKWMDKCLESLEKQSVVPDEVIIWDDCSVDGSYDKIIHYSQTSNLNIVVGHNEKNCGPSVSREKAVKIAKSEYIAFCDADDWYELSFVESMKATAKTNKCDLLMFNNYRVRKNEKIFCDVTKSLVSEKDKAKQIALAPMALWRILVKKELLRKISFNNLYYGEDGLILCQLIASAKNPFYISRAYYNYFMRDDSAHSKPNKRCFNDSVVGYELIKQYLGEKYLIECEYIGIKNFVYGGTILGFKSGISSRVISKELKKFKIENPFYIKNIYLSRLNIAKRFYIACAYYNLIPVCRFMSFFHRFFMGH